MVATGKRRRSTKASAKTRAGSGLLDLLKMAIIVGVVVVVAVLAIKFWKGDGQLDVLKGDTFLDNIYVNGIKMYGMTYEQGVEFMNQQMEIRLSTPITLTYGNKQWQITPNMLDAKIETQGDMARAFNFGHVGSATQVREQVAYLEKDPLVITTPITYDEQKLAGYIQQIKQQIDVEPINAYAVAQKNEIFSYSESVDGLALNAEALQAQVDECIRAAQAPTIQLVPDVWKPKYTSEAMEEGTQTIADVKTSTKGSNDDRISNIKRALKPFNGMTVAVGETVSFNRVAGKRTAANGYKKAQEFLDGEVIEGIGGGTCQASSTLYRALVLAGMTIDKRYQHSMVVSYVRPGYDATVTDSGKVKDLVFTNNTEYPIYIYTYCDGNEAQVRIKGMRPEYRIEFVIQDLTTNVQATSYTPKPDTKRRYVQNPEDPPVMYAEGRPGGSCDGWVIHYDWNTELEVRRERISRSVYEPVKPIYWVYSP